MKSAPRAPYVVLFGLCALAALALPGCQTNRARDVSAVTVGMHKSVVLDMVGGPDRVQRWKGRDRWMYVQYEGAAETVREIEFDDGKVTYSGPARSPKLSAAERDRLNDETNVREDARLKRELQAEREAALERNRKLQESLEEEAAQPKKAPKWEPIR